jgi:uncharacterized protein (DUF885 family)
MSRGAQLVLAVLLPGACLISSDGQQPDGVRELVRAPADMPELVRRYDADRRALESFYGLRASPTRAERLARFGEEWRRLLDEVEFERLGPDGRVDWLLLAGELEAAQRERAAEAARESAIAELVPFAAEITALEEGRWRREEPEPRAVAGELARLCEAVEALEKRVKRAEPATGAAESAPGTPAAPQEAEAALEITRELAQRAATRVSELEGALTTWFRQRDGYEPDFGWWVAQPYQELDSALESYAKHLRREVAGLKGEDDDPLVGDPIGREALLDALAAERLCYSPEELIAIGERELAWCEARLLEAARDLGHGEDWRAALEHVKGLHVAPGEQDELVAEQARAAIAFLDERQLVTIENLCRETWRLDMMTEEGQRTLPFAAYGGQKMLVAYPTAGMEHEKKEMSLRGNNIHFSRIVTPHELIPGHHLQGYMAQRYAAWRAPFRTPFLSEGWALYWEMLLWDLGYARGPEDRIGMLFWRMHRCARIQVSLRFHLGQMTTAEMVDYLVEKVGLERDGATAEVRRYVGGSYGPLYQCAYMIGGLQLYALHEELVENGTLQPRELHDAVLRENAIPVELIRARLAGHELTRDWQPSWRFAGDP